MEKQHIPEKMFRVGAAWTHNSYMNYEMSFTEIDGNKQKAKRKVRRKIDKLARQIDKELNRFFEEQEEKK